MSTLLLSILDNARVKITGRVAENLVAFLIRDLLIGVKYLFVAAGQAHVAQRHRLAWWVFQGGGLIHAFRDLGVIAVRTEWTARQTANADHPGIEI
jgi:hypothetical protein